MKHKDGIFFWLCLGAHVWYSMKERGERLPVPNSMKSYLASRKDELDMLGEFLCQRGYIPTTKDKTDDGITFVSLQDLYHQYSAWCDMNFIKNKYSKMTVASMMSQRGYEKDVQRIGTKTSRGYWVRISE